MRGPSPQKDQLRLRRFARDARGATAIEYGLIAALVVIAMIVGLSSLGAVVSAMWGGVNTKVTNAH